MLNYIWAFMILLGVIYAACTGQMNAVTNAALDSAGEAISLCITMAGVMALWMGLMEIAKEAGLIQKMTRGISPFLNFMFPRIPKEHPAREYIATNIIANILGLGWACTPAGLKAMEELAKLEEERGNPEYMEAEQYISAMDKAVVNKAAMDNTTMNNTAMNNTAMNKMAMNKAAVDKTAKDKAAKDKAAMSKNTVEGDSGRSARKNRIGRERAASNEMCNFLILNISSLQLIPVNMIAYRSQYGSANPAVIIAPAIVATLISTITAIGYCKLKDGRR